MKKRLKELVTIDGLVTPTEWDETGRVTEVKVCADGELDFSIKPGGRGDRLLGMVREFVTISGFLTAGSFDNEIEVQTVYRRLQDEKRTQKAHG